VPKRLTDEVLFERSSIAQVIEKRARRENLALREEIDKVSMFEPIVGTSPTLQAELAHVAKVVMLSNPARYSIDFQVITNIAALTVPPASPICFSRYTGGATDSLRFRANAI